MLPLAIVLLSAVLTVSARGEQTPPVPSFKPDPDFFKLPPTAFSPLRGSPAPPEAIP